MVDSKHQWKAWIYLSPAIVLLLIFTVWPIINTVRLAFLENYSSAAAIGGQTFESIYNALKNTDRYMALADFEDYRNTQQRISRDFLDRDSWNKMSLMNISGAGRFAADRAINEYAANIWNAKSALKK